jgi:hypothetical protein
MVNPIFTWARSAVPGYECSSLGDKRFSAFYALMPDSRSVEQHYQCDVKGYDPGGRNWRLGKGKPPLDPATPLWERYLALWATWAKQHPAEMKVLRQRAEAYGYCLTDSFATTPINQARALAELLNQGY